MTVDQWIPHQHSMSGRRISVIVLRAPGNDIDTLKQMTGVTVLTLAGISEGEVIQLDYSARRDG